MRTPNEIHHIAEMRALMHVGHSSSRPLSVDYELIGVVGEVAFQREFEVLGFMMDEENRPGGDKGIDFESHSGTIDVKTARKPHFLFVEEGKAVTDIYVLAKYHEGLLDATLIGWCYREEIAGQPVKCFGGHRIRNHYLPADKLRPIVELKELIVFDLPGPVESEILDRRKPTTYDSRTGEPSNG